MFTPTTRHLVVDDERTLAPPGQVTHVRTSADALAALTDDGPWDWVWLDHDLGGTDTARPVAVALEEAAAARTRRPANRVVVHTANPVGRSWLAAATRAYHPVIVNAADWAAR